MDRRALPLFAVAALCCFGFPLLLAGLGLSRLAWIHGGRGVAAVILFGLFALTIAGYAMQNRGTHRGR